MNLLERRQSGQSVWDFMNEIERMFDAVPTRSTSEFQPRVDVKETEDHYLIAADLPGISRDAVKVEFHDGRLSVSGERKSEKTSDDKRFHRIERSFGSFQRTFQLPNDANGEQIQARFEDGVLEILVPKTAVKKSRSIQIETDKKGLFSKLLNQSPQKTEKREDH